MAMVGEFKKRIDWLRREIRRHDYLYYIQNQPEISDQQYDRLFTELKALEAEHPEEQNVGASLVGAVVSYTSFGMSGTYAFPEPVGLGEIPLTGG